MMKQVINILFRDKELEKIINPPKIKPHVTLVYPFQGVNQKELFKHIKEVVRRTPPFKVILKGHQKSRKGNYLYLLVSKGRRKVSKLHREFNTGILGKFKNKDLPRYIPHVSLGNFKTKKQLEEMQKEIEKLNIKIKLEIKKITLLTVGKNDSIIKRKDFKLK